MELVSLERARQVIGELKQKYYYSREQELVPLDQALGREVSVPIIASKMSPDHDIATMDGFAINADHDYPFNIGNRIYAGDEVGVHIEAGQAAAVATGAFMPMGANAVLKIEDATISDDKVYGPLLPPWTNVMRAGSDYRVGDMILMKMQKLTPQSMALLFGLDIEEVQVYRKMKVGIISTGTEVFNGMVKNTNAVMIAAFLREWGCDAELLDTIPDDYEITGDMIRSSASRYDVIMTTGGVSVGEKDHVHRVIRSIGEMMFHKVRIRPGKPLAVGIVDDTPVFGLPGKPTGAFAALEMVVRHFFTTTPRPSTTVMMDRDIPLPEDGFNYILFVKNMGAGLQTMGYEGSDLPLFSSGDRYGVSLISASPRSSVVDGYVVTDHDIRKGENVTVHLFN